MEPFYQIVDRAAWLPRLLPVGARLLQLRVKSPETAETAPKNGVKSTQTSGEVAFEAFVAEEVKTALGFCRAAGATLVVNDHWQLAIDLGAEWIHLGQEDLQTADLKAIRRAGLKLGVSTHSDEELENGLSVNPDYVALGPIYPTTLKVMPWAPQGLETIGRWKRMVGDRPLVAIGGITLERGPGVYAAGADSIAVVSDVLGAAHPEVRLKDWLDLADKQKGTKT